jgi:hypothetical protein
MAELIEGNQRLGEVVFLTDSIEKRSCWIRFVMAEQLDVKKQFFVDVCCGV